MALLAKYTTGPISRSSLELVKVTVMGSGSGTAGRFVARGTGFESGQW